MNLFGTLTKDDRCKGEKRKEVVRVQIRAQGTCAKEFGLVDFSDIRELRLV